MLEPSKRIDNLASDVIGCGIEVHRHLGPGFGEDIYERSLCYELDKNGLAFERQVVIEVSYKGEHVGHGIADIIVEDEIVLELKTVSQLLKVHRAQLYSYLKAADLRVGLLMNFKAAVLRDGLKRVIHTPS